MQPHTSPFSRYAVVAALALISASCNSDPARIGSLSGDPARELDATFSPANPVLIARAHEDVVAVVFTEDEADVPRVLDEILVPEVEGCGRGGWFGRNGWIGREGPVLCCDRVTGTFVLNSERGWLRTGERCAPSGAEERTVDRDSGQPEDPGIEFVQVDPRLSQILEDLFRIDYRFMQLADANGTARALVNGPLPSEASSSPWMMQGGSGIRAGSEVIPASHKKPTPAGGCVSTIDSCSLGGNARCRKRWNHVYYRDSSSGDWCEFPPTCGC